MKLRPNSFNLKLTTWCLFFVLSTSQTFAQFFVQKLPQDKIQFAEEAYMLLSNGDTIRGKLGAVSFRDGFIDKINIRVNGERFSAKLADIDAFGVIPGQGSGYEDMALLPALKNLKNKEFIEVLPKDGWIIYEKIRLPGKQERYQLAQLLNPGFDSKIKVFEHPEGESTGSTKVNGITLDGLRDNRFYVSVNGDRVIEITDLQYRKRALEQIFNFCTELRDKKLKWKEFPEDVFLHFQKCL
jgi:hypothetical protein